MDVFILGITGQVGELLARRLLARGDTVRGLVRREDERAQLAAHGIESVVGDLAGMSVAALASAFGRADVVVFSAGSNGGSRRVTRTVDGEAVDTTIAAAHLAGVERIALVSVLPESWRERDLGEEVEYYFAVKKAADVAVSRSDLDWLILRPSLLVDGPGQGTVSLGPAEMHGRVTRDDVAATLAALLHEPRVRRRLLELNSGTVPIAEAVAAQVG